MKFAMISVLALLLQAPKTTFGRQNDSLSKLTDPRTVIVSLVNAAKINEQQQILGATLRINNIKQLK